MHTGLQRVAQASLSGQVAALSVADFDTIPFTQFSATKYLINISKPDGTNFQTIELLAAKILNDVDDQIHGKFPGGLNVSVKSFKDVTDVKLRVTNNENFLVNASIVKIPIQ